MKDSESPVQVTADQGRVIVELSPAADSLSREDLARSIEQAVNDVVQDLLNTEHLAELDRRLADIKAEASARAELTEARLARSWRLIEEIGNR